MSGNRLIVLGLFVLSLIGISFFGGPVTYGFFFLLLIVPVVSLFYAFITYIRFRIYQRIESVTVVAGSLTPYYLSLQNEDPYTISGIRVSYYDDFSSIDELTGDTEYELLPHTGIREESRLICRYRGEYTVGVRTVTVQDYLRLFAITFKNREPLRVTVMPHLTVLDELRYATDVSVTARDSQTDLSSPDVLVRDYIPGDDIRSINWKATARTGKPMVRTRIGEDTAGIAIIMDSCRYSDALADYLPLENKILETALALAYYYAGHGIGTVVYSHQSAPYRYALDSLSDFEELYGELSSFRFDAKNTHEDLFGAATGDRALYEADAVIYVLAKWSTPAAYLASDLEKRSVPVQVYLIGDGQRKDEPDKADGHTDGAGADGLASSDRISFIRVGCEDRLEEVL